MSKLILSKNIRKLLNGRGEQNVHLGTPGFRPNANMLNLVCKSELFARRGRGIFIIIIFF